MKTVKQAEKELTSAEMIEIAREALTNLQPGATISLASPEMAGRIQQVRDVLPLFPAVMRAHTGEGREVYMCNHGKGTYILYLKTKLSDTGKPHRQWMKDQLRFIDIALYGFHDAKVYENYLEAPTKGIFVR